MCLSRRVCTYLVALKAVAGAMKPSTPPAKKAAPVATTATANLPQQAILLVLAMMAPMTSSEYL